MESTSIRIKIGNFTTQISSVYKSLKNKLESSDLTSLTNHNYPFVVAGDLNPKHTTCYNSHNSTTGIALVQHMEITNTYGVIVSDSPTRYPYNITHQPNVLDFALIYLSSKLRYNLENHNDISSNPNPQVISINAELVSISSPALKKRTNWKKISKPNSHIKLKSNK